MATRRWPIVLLVFVVLMLSGLVFMAGVVMILVGEKPVQRKEITVVELEGQIFDSQEFVRDLEKLREAEEVKAVVVRINSPGGLVSPSQEIYSSLVKLREKKKVVASMGSVAASGGYYVACGAEKIVANGGSITGSIGVRIDHVNMEQLIALMRVEPQVLTSGPYKDVGSPLRPLRPDEEKLLRDIIADLYGQFRETVARERDLEGDALADVTDGRVFTGQEALAVGLIDQIGTLEDAIDLAAELAGIEGKPDVAYPREDRPSWLRFIVDEATQQFVRVLTRQQGMPQLLWQL